jgi:glycosyltransferase involved in cell wall biosynthesis
MQCKVEILLATYNGEKYLEQQIESLFNQTYTNWCALIRDDGSTDGTLQIIHQYVQRFPDKFRLLISETKNIGATFNFSKLLEASTEEYVMLCDQDDVWLNNKIELSLAELKKMEQQYSKEKPLLVFTDLMVVNDELKPLHPSFWKTRKTNPAITKTWYKAIAHSAVTGCTILMNRAAVETSLPVTINNFQHDHWIGIHVAYFGFIHYLNIPTVYYRQHSGNSVGAQKLSAKYFLSRVNYFPLLIRDWILLKKKSAVKVPLEKVFLYKVYYNILRLF